MGGSSWAVAVTRLSNGGTLLQTGSCSRIVAAFLQTVGRHRARNVSIFAPAMIRTVDCDHQQRAKMILAAENVTGKTELVEDWKESILYRIMDFKPEDSRRKYWYSVP
jgi:hypothetical protein